MAKVESGADRYVESLLPDFFDGYACEVGANNGDFGSNTLLFEQLGWTVLCIEPNPLHEKHGRANRRLWRQLACSDHDSEGEQFEAVGEYPWGADSALVGDVGKPQYPKNGTQYFTVKVRTLDRVLEDAGFPRLDFLSVDVECWERKVMAGFTVERWKPKVIVLEEWTENAIVIPGYTIKDRLCCDNIYLRDSE